MNRRAALLGVWAVALWLAGCAGQAPFQPAPVRFGRVDFLEARGAPAAPLALSLSCDACSPSDAFLATVRFDAALVGKKRPARLTVLHGGAEVASLDVPDVRNTRLDAHVQLRNAPPGEYTLRVETDRLSAEKAFSVR